MSAENGAPVAQGGVREVALYEIRRLTRGRHALARHGVVALPLAMAIVVTIVRLAFGENTFTPALVLGGHGTTVETEIRGLARMFRLFDLRWVIFLSAAGLFGGLFSGERAERTLHHAFLQPVSRATLTVGKYAGGVIVLWASATVAWILTVATWMLPLGPGAMAQALLSGRGLADTLAHVLVLLLACVAYGGLFLLAGALWRAPALFALLVLVWEAACAFLPLAMQRFTVFYWLDSILPLRIPAGSALAVLAEPASPPVAVLVCLLIGGAGVAATTWRARSMEVSYGASE